MNLMMILRQLWNQRAANGWILGELVVVTYFLWGVVDPVYVLLSDKALPDNYDLTDTYLLSMVHTLPIIPDIIRSWIRTH